MSLSARESPISRSLTCLAGRQRHELRDRPDGFILSHSNGSCKLRTSKRGHGYVTEVRDLHTMLPEIEGFAIACIHAL